MAGLACQSEDGNNAVFVGTFLESGLGITVCTECLVDFFTAMLQEMTGAPVAELIAHQQEVLEQARVDESPTSGDDAGPTSPESSGVGTDGDPEEESRPPRDIDVEAIDKAAHEEIDDDIPLPTN